MSSKVIGTHSGAFQADEALGCWMLRRLEQYRDSKVIRSRDMEVLKPLDIVIDVAGEYDHSKLRYDHHQRGFFETFDGEPGVATGPENATGVFKTKLSASGLVYKHYGRDIIGVLYPELKGAQTSRTLARVMSGRQTHRPCYLFQGNAEKMDWVYNKMYVDFMEAIDGNDNGVEIADECRYKERSSLPHRVHRLNSRWNASKASYSHPSG